MNRQRATPIRVLVVDDSAVVRGVLGRIVDAQPDMQVVTTATNGSDALDALRLQPIDVVLLDIEMPVMDGLTALPLICKRFPATRVLVTSALTHEGATITTRALALGAIDYVHKPSTQGAGVLGVVNVGIGGNRVLLDGYGPNAVSRVDWDVLARSGARSMIVMESINDIGRFVRDHQPYGDLAQRLETGLAQLAAQAHQHNIAVIGATLTPYQGCGYYSVEGDAVRQAVNQWIRTSHTFDGVADFDKVVRDPQNPLHFAAQYDSGDHLHPKDAGYQAMANAIDLSLLTKER